MFTNFQQIKKVPELGQYPEGTWLWHEKSGQMFYVLPKKIISFGAQKVDFDNMTFTKRINLSYAQVHKMGAGQVLIERVEGKIINPVNVLVFIKGDSHFRPSGLMLTQGGFVVEEELVYGVWMVMPLPKQLKQGSPLTCKFPEETEPERGQATIDFIVTYKLL